ncbi:MAG TPA: hypothetical protein VIG80_16110 [Bacillaceae bacterium]
MHFAQSVEEVLEFAEKARANSANGNLYVSQSEMAPDEVFFGDEDTGRGNAHQLFSILLETSQGSIFYNYHFLQPFDLEDVNEILDQIESFYPKSVLDKKELDVKLEQLERA